MPYSIQDLYDLPPRDLYLMDLVGQCGQLEYQLTELADQLPEEQRMLIEAYIEIRNELEFQSIKRAIQFGKGCLA